MLRNNNYSWSWYLVSEYLPTKDGEYKVTTMSYGDDEKMYDAYFDTNDQSWYRHSTIHSTAYRIDNVIAWMPLIEPYYCNPRSQAIVNATLPKLAKVVEDATVLTERDIYNAVDETVRVSFAANVSGDTSIFKVDTPYIDVEKFLSELVTDIADSIYKKCMSRYTESSLSKKNSGPVKVVVNMKDGEKHEEKKVRIKAKGM